MQQPPAEPSRARRLAGLVFEKYYNNSLLVNFAVAILLAFAKPSIGLALRPDITAKWIAVVLIFVMYTALSLPIVLAYPDAAITFQQVPMALRQP